MCINASKKQPVLDRFLPRLPRFLIRFSIFQYSLGVNTFLASIIPMASLFYLNTCTINGNYNFDLFFPCQIKKSKSSNE